MPDLADLGHKEVRHLSASHVTSLSDILMDDWKDIMGAIVIVREDGHERKFTADEVRCGAINKVTFFCQH